MRLGADSGAVPGSRITRTLLYPGYGGTLFCQSHHILIEASDNVAPRSVDSVGSEDEASRRGPAGPAAGRVLVAERNTARRRQLCESLAGAGYAVTEASTSEMAIAAYAADPAPFVLLNTELDGAGGVDVCRRIRALDEALASYILVYARQDVLGPVLDSLDAGADDYVLNPDNHEILRTRLAIAGRRLAREDLRRAAEADAARARYLAGVGEMAIALQHEINNPLAAILAHAELMAMEAAGSGTTDESLTTILEQARRIAAVVRKLSSLRNPTSVEYVPGKRMVHLHDDG